jgi:hypothetical protein
MSQPGGENQPSSGATQVAPAQPPRHSVGEDIANGLLRGDFAPHLGPAGAMTQIVVGFVPGIGSVAACRDLVADIGQRRPFSAMLNVISIVPGVGGFSKMAQVMSRAMFAGEAFVVVRDINHRRAFADGRFDHIPANPAARLSIISAFFGPLVTVALAAFVFVPNPQILPLATLWGVFALPLLAIVAGIWGGRRARRLQIATPGLEVRPGGFAAGAGRTLGFLGVVFLGLMALVVLGAAQSGALAAYH